MAKLHEGICGSHVGGRSLASKVIRAGFFWPTVKEDCARHAQRCKQCQKHADWHKAPPEELRSIYSPWPFHTWGIDICTDQVIGCDDVVKRKVGSQEVNVVVVCKGGVLQHK